MSHTFTDVTHAALDLDDQEREQLADILLRSLDHVDDIDRAWMEEARRRHEAIRSGTTPTLPHEDVVSRLEARFG